MKRIAVALMVFAANLMLAPLARADGFAVYPAGTALNVETIINSSGCPILGITMSGSGAAADMDIGIYTGPSSTGPWQLTATGSDPPQGPAASLQFDVARASWVRLNVDIFNSGTTNYLIECFQK